jgi:hypothetical protein
MPTTRRARRAAPPPPPPKPWWKRWWERPRTRRRVLILSTLAFIALLAFVTARLFVVPRAAEVPLRADAVVTLAGEEPQVTKALELMNQQVAGVLVVSGGADPQRTLAYRLCTQPQPFEVLCPATEPMAAGSVGTVADQPEAQTVGRMATERGWSQLALVGLPEQLSRAQLLMGRCTSAQILPVMVETPIGQRLEHLGGEAADYLRALFLDRSC